MSDNSKTVDTLFCVSCAEKTKRLDAVIKEASQLIVFGKKKSEVLQELGERFLRKAKGMDEI